jgi:diamine N-acetyltransferase
LRLHQVYANITSDNQRSISLFEKLHFEKIGLKKDWIKTANTFKNVLLYQLINNDHD